MRRRDFIRVVAGSAITWPLVARAQQPAMPMIGFLNGATAAGWAPFVAAFRQGLIETGYIEGQNVAIEYRFADGEYDRLPAMAADLVHRRVSIIAATTTPAALAAKAATTTIPVVFTTTGDPVQMGLVASLSRPGGNITGVTRLNVEVAPKLLELMHEIVPTATRIALLVNPTGPNAETLSKEIEAAARVLGVEVTVLHGATESDLDKVFSTFAQLSAGALVIGTDPFFTTRSQQLATLTLRGRVPAIYSTRAFATAGGLMYYGGNITNLYRLAGGYAARILRGEKPADLPVQQSTKLELVINLKTAKALGLTVPQSLLGRADEVIE
jgi:putative ABC transport system substrate-binding protein